jgi:aminocarboxymuconate-semialdehyde decarboxylase
MACCADGHPSHRPHSHISASAWSRRGLLGLGAFGASLLAFGTSRSGFAQTAASDVRAVDTHAHFMPLPFLRSLAQEGGPPNYTVDMSNPDAPSIPLGGTRIVLDPTYWDLDKRLVRMNGQGVHTHALSLTAPMVHWAAPERGAKLARLVNDAMQEAHTAFPERFVGCATLPLQDPALALAEINRVAGMKGIRGFYLPTNAGRELGDPAFFPLYERCEALGLPVLLHPVGVIGAERLAKQYYLNNLLGNPMDTTIAAAHLVFGGVMDRYPKLNVVLPHSGGALPFLWGRLQHGQNVRAETKGKAQKPFIDYVRRFHYDTIVHSPDLLRFLVGLVGADHVMLGSDYCFDMGYEKPREIIMQAGLSAPERDKILGGNAAKLLRL